jgi:predicted enzyme related to lactoylglutathione lyase
MEGCVFFEDALPLHTFEQLEGLEGAHCVGVGNRSVQLDHGSTFVAEFFYANVTDLDAAIDRAKKRNAKVMNGPMKVEGGGRIAQLSDPQGAAFALFERSPA